MSSFMSATPLWHTSLFCAEFVCFKATNLRSGGRESGSGGGGFTQQPDVTNSAAMWLVSVSTVLKEVRLSV